MTTLDRTLKRLGELTELMADYRDLSSKAAEERRRLLYELNRKSKVSYAQLSEAANINPARTAIEIRKERQRVEPA